MRCERLGYSSVMGAMHERYKLPNQDAYLVKRMKCGTLLVVSDGMGSHPHSEIGAQAVCRSVSKAVQIWLEKGCHDVRLLIPILHALWRLEIFPYPKDECGATCLFSFVDFEGRTYLGQLGDGSIFFDVGDGTQILKTKDDDFTNLTTGMNSISGYSDWCLTSLETEQKNIRICLMTDGVSETLVENRKIDFVNLLWKKIAEKNNQVERNNLVFRMLDQWNPVNAGDDRTLVSYELK